MSITSSQFAQIIYVDKAKLQPGQESSLTFTINNIGSAPLMNLVFSWSEAKGAVLPVYSGDTKYVKYLDIGQSIEIPYKVVADINVVPGLYQLDLNLQYESALNSSPTTIHTKAGVLIGGETDFDVAFSQSSAGQTSLSVANTGNNPAQSVSVRIPLQESVSLQGTNSAIIGNLDKGDYTLVSFQMSQRGANATQSRQGTFNGNRQNNTQFTGQRNASMSNMLRVIIDYTDTTGQRRGVEKLVPIQFRSTTGTNASGATTTSIWKNTSLWIIIFGIAIAIVVYMNYKKRAKNKP